MLMGNYLGKLMVAANHNPNVLDTLLHVQNMIASPELFFRSDIVLQVVTDGSPIFSPCPPPSWSRNWRKSLSHRHTKGRTVVDAPFSIMRLLSASVHLAKP
jgi:hypothetical protein